MKKIIVFLLVAVMSMSLMACAGKVENEVQDEVKEIEVNGETVSATDFLVENLKEYMNSEAYLERQENYENITQTEAKDLKVTRVIEVSAEGLGINAISLHILAVIAECDYADDESSLYSKLLLIVDYETGIVYDGFSVDESWFEKEGTKEEQLAYLFNGILVGDYESGVIIIDSEERTELSQEVIDEINAELSK